MRTIKRMKTYVAKPSELKPLWHVFDASKEPLGRMATKIATILQGKHRPIYTPTINTGDFVIVINASKPKTTGKKMEQKTYNHHSGFPGGLKTYRLDQMLERNPTRVIELAVHGMLPKTVMGKRMMKRLKIYPGDHHPHQPQLGGFGFPTDQGEVSG